MADYTDLSAVEQLLAANRAAVDVDLGRIVDEVSGTIDDAMRALVNVPFNSVTDTPATPWIIRRAAQHLAAAQALKEHSISAGTDGLINAANDLGQAGVSFLEEVIAADGATAPVAKSGVALTFGDSANNWTPSTSEALIASPAASGYPVNILPYSAVLVGTSQGGSPLTDAEWGGMRLGYEYSVAYSTTYNAWLFTSSDSRLEANPTHWTLTYRWDYRIPTVERSETFSRSGILFCG